MNRKELEADYVKRWGNARKCPSCGFLLAHGPDDSNKPVPICCGQAMPLVNHPADSINKEEPVMYQTAHAKKEVVKVIHRNLEARIGDIGQMEQDGWRVTSELYIEHIPRKRSRRLSNRILMWK